MSFITWHYPVFLLLVFAVYWQLPLRGRLLLLTFSSYFFYACWDVRFLALILATTCIDYLCGRSTGNSRPGLLVRFTVPFLPGFWLLACYLLPGWAGVVTSRICLMAFLIGMIFAVLYQYHWSLSDSLRRKWALGLSLSLNFLILGFFKYYGFFRESLMDWLEPLGLAPSLPVLTILLPVGISFYTFQSASYVIDTYRGKTTACRDFLSYSTYISFFPQLVAGPIERSRTLLPQILEKRQFSSDSVLTGCRLILVGFFKKVFIADNCALLANFAFDTDTPLNGYWILIGVVAFTFQIYGDFSGYTDIARGSARFFGIRLNQNFHYPYFSFSPSDFWRRWHVSLSEWFRDYVYIPLGGNRSGHGRTLWNLSLTMFIAGLWHGAAWTFVLWGLYHGLLLVLFRITPFLNRLDETTPRIHQLIWSVPLMWVLVMFGWSLFRAPDLSSWTGFLGQLTHWDSSASIDWVLPTCWLLFHSLPLILLQLVSFRQRDEVEFQRLAWPIRGFIYALLFLLTVTSVQHDQEFIYFQF
jgi:alginate O-acetyltransferase complex protein AlgI